MIDDIHKKISEGRRKFLKVTGAISGLLVGQKLSYAAATGKTQSIRPLTSLKPKQIVLSSYVQLGPTHFADNPSQSTTSCICDCICECDCDCDCDCFCDCICECVGENDKAFRNNTLPIQLSYEVHYERISNKSRITGKISHIEMLLTIDPVVFKSLHLKEKIKKIRTYENGLAEYRIMPTKLEPKSLRRKK